MRSIDEVTELSYESFIETYGRVNGNYHQGSNGEENASAIPKINVTRDKQDKKQTAVHDDQKNNRVDNGSRNGSLDIISFGSSYDSGSDNSHSTKIHGKKQNLRKISVEKLASLGGAIQAAVTSKRSKSNSFSDKNGLPKLKQDRKVSNWIPNVPPYFSRKQSDDSTSISTEEGDNSSVKSEGRTRSRVRVPSPLSIPGSRLGTCAHRGYLDCRNKKKQWEIYWCVLQDACLYCYHTPQSDVTRDVILLRGYDVIADVTNLKRSRYIFRLQQQNFPTLHFSCDNHRDYLLWVGTLEKETRCVFSRRYSDDSMSPTAPTEEKISMKSTKLVNADSQRQVDTGLLNLQKERLFKELALQKEQLVEEQKVLEKLESTTSDDPLSKVTLRKTTKEQIVNQYEKDRLRQELKTKEFLTLLNRRRYSCHLKLSQYTKNLAPGTGPRNKENHTHFAAMENKLKEMQESLALIDRELEEEEACKQHNIERLDRKRDLELLIMEQQDTIDILRGHQTDQLSFFGSSMTPSSTRSRDTLRSIDELSDDLVTSSIASTSSEGNAGGDQSHGSSSFPDLPTAPHPCSVSVPCEEPYPVDVDGMDCCGSSDNDSGCQVSSGIKMDNSYEFYQSVIKSFFSSPEKKSSLGGEEYRDIPDVMDLSSKESTLKATPSSVHPEKIDSATLAKIEDFELFAKLKLEASKTTKKNVKVSSDH